ANRSRHLRIETRARNALTRTIADAAGKLPAGTAILAEGPPALTLPAPSQRLLAAARVAGLPAAVSSDAGSYLCNYLCWRASEAAARTGGPRLAAFIHVPMVGRNGPRSARRVSGRMLAFPDLVRAGEAIVAAALAAGRLR